MIYSLVRICSGRLPSMASRARRRYAWRGSGQDATIRPMTRTWSSLGLGRRTIVGDPANCWSQHRASRLLVKNSMGRSLLSAIWLAVAARGCNSGNTTAVGVFKGINRADTTATRGRMTTSQVSALILIILPSFISHANLNSVS